MSDGPLAGGLVIALRPDVPAARAIFDQVVAAAWTSRDDLVGVQGARVGSGRTDGEFWSAGEWFVKTRGTRRFAHAAEAIAAADRMLALKRQLGELTLVKTVFAVVATGDAPRVWTIAPTVITLRERLDEAAAGANWREFGRALTAFANALGEALSCSIDHGLGLDANPANFAIQGARLRYLDDDVAATTTALGLEDAFVARFAEYPTAPPEIWDLFVQRAADEIGARAPRALRAQLGLAGRLTAAATLRRAAPPHAARLCGLLEARA